MVDAVTIMQIAKMPSRWGAAISHPRVPQVVFNPIGTRQHNAAPFNPNDQMLEVLPIGVVVFSGSGIWADLADTTQLVGRDTPDATIGFGLDREACAIGSFQGCAIDDGERSKWRSGPM